MSNTSHPISLLKQEWTTTIRNEAASAEKQGKLTKKQLNLIHEQDWFKLLAPSSIGGKQYSLPDAMELMEALACADGSLGWVVTLCSGASWFTGFMNPETAKAIMSSDKACIAGSGDNSGTAELKGGKYTINGKWAYASGAGEATAFTVNCKVVEGGKTTGTISVVLMKDEVTVNDDWNGMGMAATNSCSFEVKGVTVGEDRIFRINDNPTAPNAIYAYPFLQLAEATLAANLCGMAYHFMDLCKTVIEEKDESTSEARDYKDSLIDSYNTLSKKLHNQRQKLYYAVDMSWQLCSANKNVSQSVLYKVTSAAAVSVTVIRDCVNFLYPHCGMSAGNKSSEINRVFRDINTAGLHSLLAGNGIL